MKLISTIAAAGLMWSSLSSFTHAEEPGVDFRVDAFVGKQDGYHTYRIPVMVVTAKGTVLLFAEGRKRGRGDGGDIDQIMKRSEDGGKTWSQNLLIHEEGDSAPIRVGNPVPIVDRDGKTVHLFFAVMASPNGDDGLYYTKSTDDGVTWAPMVVTSDNPKDKGYSDKNFLKGFGGSPVGISVGPGNGIHTSKGRLVVPSRLFITMDEKPAGGGTVIYSDDGGKTWQAGGAIPLTDDFRMDEPTVVERSDGSLIMKVEPDRMLWPFHQYAGLPTKGERYGGWAKKDCVGHEAGHYLSALALMYASTGDAEMKKRADYMVSEIAKVQEKHGDGYAGPVRLEVWQKAFSGDIKADAWGMCGGYVPWYVMHKVYAGLIDAHVLTGNKQALEVVTKFADWAKKGTDNLTEEQFQKMLACEFGGMVESLSELYALTGKKDYLTLARRFDHKAITDPLAAKQDILTGKHVNTNLPKILGAARMYELDGQQRDATIATFLWDSMVDSRTFAPGGMDVRERYIPAGQESKLLATNASESCVVYNTLKLTRQLFGWQPDARYMDYYERGLYNTILCSQDPKSGGYTYFNSLKPGHFKIYSSPDDAMWCCVGTGMENHSKYADTIYSRDAESLWVNLFIPSELNWQEKGLTVRQETEFPVKDTTTLKIGTKQAQKLAVKIRVPYWATKAPEITVNGEKQAIDAKPASYLTLTRTWKDGDTIKVQFPMSLHLRPARDDKSMVVVMYGPLVLAGELGTEGMPPSLVTGNNVAHLGAKTPPVPVLVDAAAEPATWLKREPGEGLRFRTTGVAKPQDVTLSPLALLHHQRYTVYWKTMTAADYTAQAPAQ